MGLRMIKMSGSGMGAGKLVFDFIAQHEVQCDACPVGWLRAAHNPADRGNLRARKVLVCANGYTGDLISGLRQTVVPIHSVQVAPAPPSGNLCATSLLGLHVPSGTRRRLSYFRTVAAGRFIMGARGAYTPGATRAWLAQARAVSVQLFSQLAVVQWEYEWGGYIAATGNHYPYPYPYLHDWADWASGVPLWDLNCPVSALRKIPFHNLHRLGVDATVVRYKLMDRMGLQQMVNLNKQA